ncbi:glucuronate isomerase [Leadbettera azotonutricia]|uniref:Uronate isomerase n=1 Tax=Leadbettera azotonutricia (strain ATCC BAA-888 / DSM 13862 / ZAS-9) TaxID=545695 RepID=F5YGD4_LEAAZ|nr:glucuronate isomerase [Leadbettera azotonutricia]AEF81455.1 glucuronate isomerase [Leadbettera azotonutricia ZAS-9]
MKQFMDKDFLLGNETARRLFHEAAAAEAIFDYHCHLPPQEIAENRRFANLAQVWLGEGNFGDHYKWRALRANGVDEKLITGKDADPYDRFLAWAETMPRLLGNPLYHWTHLELQRYFDIHDPLDKGSAPAIWKAANEKLQNDPDFSVYGIFRKFKVYAVGTTDDPADSLEYHQKIKASGEIATKVLPSFRPDKALNIEKEGFAAYIARLGRVAGKSINSLPDLLQVLKERVAFFDKLGCRASDHGLEYVPFEAARDGTTGILWEKEAAETFAKAMAGGKVDAGAAESYKTFVLSFLAGEYAEKGWAMQLHAAALRNNNTRAFKAIGPDTGYDAVHDLPMAAKLSRFLDNLEVQGKLPRTILYSLNFADFYPMATIMGCFQGGIPGKMQLGSSWWFLDHKDGMEDQMKLLGNVGLLSHFVGMLTDSRSFLSYPRHEYFRRILCNLLGTWAEDGEIPNDFNLLSGMAKDISFGNAFKYFNS